MMAASSAIVLLYPSLLASLVNFNQTIFADDNGILYAIDTNEPVFTQQEIAEMNESVLKITFYLYTRNNPKISQEIFIDDVDSVRNSFWNPKHPTRLITHGWFGNTDTPTCTLIRDAYLQSGDYNIIMIDWREPAADIWYLRIASKVPFIAKCVAKLLDFLQINADLDLDRTSIIGHSLGGHVAGLSARFTIGKIAEVIALDPAKPLFESKEPGQRVDRSDASLVQVIHTNTGAFGIEKQIGAADFYPNGGRNQPGCDTQDYISDLCAHARSYQYYAESIMNPTGFRAGNVYMGGPTLDVNARGSYVLETASEPPFALG